MADAFPAPEEDGSEEFQGSDLLPEGDTEFGASQGDSGRVELKEGQQPNEPTPAGEVVFEIEGQQVPLSKVPPETIRQWHEASSNISKMAAAHTQRSQELAEQRRAFDEEAGSVREMFSQIKESGQDPKAFFQEAFRWDSLLRSPGGRNELLPLFQAWYQGHPEVRALAQKLGGSYVPVQQQAQIDPNVSRLTQRLDKLEKNNQLSERQRQMAEAFNAIRANYPDLDEAKFRLFEADMLSKIDDDKTLMELLVKAYVGDNRAAIEQRAREQYAKDKESSQKAAVETGGGSSGVTTPENINVDDMDYSDLAEEYARREGLS